MAKNKKAKRIYAIVDKKGNIINSSEGYLAYPSLKEARQISKDSDERIAVFEEVVEKETKISTSDYTKGHQAGQEAYYNFKGPEAPYGSDVWRRAYMEGWVFAAMLCQ